LFLSSVAALEALSVVVRERAPRGAHLIIHSRMRASPRLNQTGDETYTEGIIDERTRWKNNRCRLNKSVIKAGRKVIQTRSKCQEFDKLVEFALIQLRCSVEMTMAEILSLDQLRTERARLRQAGRRVVFTNGCFDLIHPGHVKYLRAARLLGDALIVALNSDRSVRELKGEKRPILDQNERAEVMAALGSVDYVTIFDEPTPREIIAALLPDVLVKGGDWNVDRIIGRDEVEAAGGAVLSLPFIEGCSTTDLIERIIRMHCHRDTETQRQRDRETEGRRDRGTERRGDGGKK
jgi:D-beta-D-heptose 7-phosphate kinase/D-beta-D-heptose 1-phosphate adenosyltransferase